MCNQPEEVTVISYDIIRRDHQAVILDLVAKSSKREDKKVVDVNVFIQLC